MYVSNVKYCEAEPGEWLTDFARKLVDCKKKSTLNVIGKFNDIFIDVKKQTTVEDIVKFYMQHT